MKRFILISIPLVILGIYLVYLGLHRKSLGVTAFDSRSLTALEVMGFKEPNRALEEIAMLAKNSDKSRRSFAILVLEEIDGPRALDVAELFFSDQDPTIRESSKNFLLRRIPFLAEPCSRIQALLSHGDFKKLLRPIEGYAVSARCESDSQKKKALIAGLAAEASKERFSKASRIFWGLWADPKNDTILSEANPLVHDSTASAVERSVAIEALAFASPSSIAKVAESLLNSTESTLRTTATTKLQLLCPNNFSGLLLAQLIDPDLNVRRSALTIALKSHSKSAYAAIQERRKKDPNQNIWPKSLLAVFDGLSENYFTGGGCEHGQETGL